MAQNEIWQPLHVYIHHKQVRCMYVSTRREIHQKNFIRAKICPSAFFTGKNKNHFVPGLDCKLGA